jgi:anti-sigma factor RsiW
VSTSPTLLSHAEIEEQLGAYALDAVDPETAAVIEAHLDECVRCAAEVSQHHEVAGLLANSGGVPPADLWDGIARRLGGTSDESWDRLAARLDVPTDRESASAAPDGVSSDGRVPQPGSPTAPAADVVPIGAARRRPRLVAAGAGLVAAAAAVIALVLGLQVHHLDGQVNAMQATQNLSTAERAAIAAPGTTRVPLSVPGAHGQGSTPATIVLNSAGTGFVINDADDGLARLPADRTYQLWGVVGSKVISLGLLGSRPGIVPFSVAGSHGVSAFAITDEVAGGVVTSSNQPVAEGKVQV